MSIGPGLRSRLPPPWCSAHPPGAAPYSTVPRLLPACLPATPPRARTG